MSELDALFFGAHPDDVEIAGGGYAAQLAARGFGVGIVDLTRGERGSRGDVETRAAEAREAAQVLGVGTRVTLGLPDLGLDASDPAQLRAVVECLRQYRPRLVVAPEHSDPHPDHVEGSHLVTRACYVAGLARADGSGERHRPRRLLYALHRSTRLPHLVIDVSDTFERRVDALRAHRSQLSGGSGPQTYLTHPEFIAELESRARVFGASIGARFGEGYRMRGPVPLDSGETLLGRVEASR
ncbi:MAG: bacillithiol biosynthesis deacetylase BshB1 [Candidatus Eisenbacteria bacterium]|uniref:Bacillithiol biosynthesis deacetylase BshB1 n=1 Tax=Eiseniibacteriota bacterium TaxID=2212470 RepID=A0A849SSR0_UNCEI|nr:bacillithiol biosynthesis deacetylase BshB1 [Candidatus Eisenbacteria bacterium]